MRRGAGAGVVLLAATLLTACDGTQGANNTSTHTPTAAATTAGPTISPAPPGALVLAVIGDYGGCAVDCSDEQRVADLVHSWSPAAILTVGDNAYDAPDKTAADILPYAADLSAGRFLPALGNEDYGDGCGAQPVGTRLDVLRHPRHYVATLGAGLLDVFVTDSECGDPDGNTATSAQARQFRAAVAHSPARWRIAVIHRSPYSSGPSGGTPADAWIAAPGVDLVLTGHDHEFEDLVAGGLHYVIDGAGGHGLHTQCVPVCAPQSVWHDNKHFGAVRLTITPQRLLVEYVAVGGIVLHAFALER